MKKRLAATCTVTLAVMGCGDGGMDVEDVGTVSSALVWPGVIYEIKNVNSGKCLDIANAGTANGDNVQQYDCWQGTNQQFEFEDMGSGYYRIRNVNSDKCFDVWGVSSSDGANIAQYTCGTGHNQQFQVVDDGGGVHHFIARHSGKALDIANSSTSNGANLQQWTWLNNNAQKFYVNQIGGGGGGGGSSGSNTLVMELENLSIQGSASPLSVQSSSSASGGKYVVWPNDGSNGYLSTPSDSATGQVLVKFRLSQTADVQFDMRADLSHYNDDSFYYKLDSGSWVTQNNVQTSGFGTLTPTTFSGLAAGDHTLRILRREDGAKLDKVTLTASAGTISPKFEGYMFAYFTGDTISGEKIYFAASQGNNALAWQQLNGGYPIFTSTLGTGGLRDPFVIRSPQSDKFYMIATDLSIGSGTSWSDASRHGSLYIEVWESTDLVNWSAQRHVKVSPDNAGNTWAPEAYYDHSLGKYVVFWASKLYDQVNDPNHTASTYQRMLYATTQDFVTFSAPQVWQDDGTSRIDSTVIQVGNVYHRFTKDEGAGSTGCNDIVQETSSNLTATLSGWTMIDFCIGSDAGTSAVEGPTIFKSNPNDVNGNYYYLFVDEYTGRNYIPLRTSDLGNPSWAVAPTYNLPSSPRHGTVMPITADELASLQAQW